MSQPLPVPDSIARRSQTARSIVRLSARLRISAAALIVLTGSILQAVPIMTAAVELDHPGSAIRPPGVAAAEPLPAAISIAAGHSHTCAIMADDTVRCWGQGGALGDGTQKRRLTPIIVTGLSTATAISAGIGHTCALLADHTIRCWGGNNWGQSGDGLPDLSARLTPVKVAGISTATAISAGENHTCARLSNGTVRCWGYNGYSQLGDGTIQNHQTPVTVPGITSAIAIAAGTGHTCALLTDHTISCWGMNSKGELGDGTTTNRTVPVDVAFISTATAISADGWAGYGRTCAILADSTARCWGVQPLGHGFSENSPTPVAVSDITTATAISVGGGHNCLLVADQTVRCWGDDTQGAVGDGSVLSYVWSPVAVASISTAIGVTTGSEHSCAVLAGGTAWCWGSNLAGQLGDDSTTPRFTPVQVNFALKTPFTDIAASDYQVDIEWVYEQGITSGCSPTLYCPLGVVRRGEMASFLARALNLSGAAPDAFTDDETSIHEVNINLVAREGIASGCGGTTFCPSGVVSREQMASFLARALHLGGWAPDAFTDDETSIHEVNINLVAREGITTGCTESGKYCPTANVTRGPMAAFLHRAFLP